VAALLVANACFLALSLTTPVSTETAVRRVQTAFATGELTDSDYLPWDGRRGWHQYGDCVLLQLVANDNPTRLGRALAPTVYSHPEADRKCHLLRDLTTVGSDADRPVRSQYARYWHGSRVPVALALRGLELVQVRRLLAGAVWLAVGMLALVAYRSGPHTRLVGLGIALVSATLWALPYFAPSLTHGPGDAALLLGLAGVIAWPRLTTDLRRIVPYAVAFGSVVAFFDMMTGQLPIAGAWLTAVTLAANRDEGAEAAEGDVPDGRVAALAALVAFALAAVATVLIKQALVIGLTDTDAVGQFAANLRLYMSAPDYEEGWPAMLEPFGRLVRKSGNLTYGSEGLGFVLIAAMVSTWIAAATIAWRSRSRHRLDAFVILGAALIPVVWILFLPTHTYLHAGFMVRILVAPIALTPVALLWQQHRNTPPA
jgi:hypothetical protein